MIRVVIVDDHAIVRRGVRQIVAEHPGIEVVAEAADYGELTAFLRDAECDVVLLDVALPGKNGIEILKSLRERHPRIRVLMFSTYPEDQYAVRALKAGASGYLTKDSAASQLVGAIRKIAAGGVHITEAVAAHLVAAPAAQDAAPHTLLSDREFEVFRQLVDGKGVSEIADRLNLSVKTVSTHKTRVLQKMNLHGTADLVRYALEHGLAGDRG